MKPRKFSHKPMYQTELKQQKCVLTIPMLEGERKKKKTEKKRKERRVYRQTQQLKAVKHPKKILAS